MFASVYVVVLLLARIQSGIYGSPPDLTVVPAEQIAFVGSTATFKCFDTETSAPVHDVYWQNDYGDFLPPKTGHSLTIANVDVDDEMNYYCVKNGFSYILNDNSAAKLYVYEYPQNLSCPSSMVFTIEELQKISCQVELGRPPANLSWYEMTSKMEEIMTTDNSSVGWFLTNSGGVQWGGGYVSTVLTAKVKYLVNTEFEKIMEGNISILVGEAPAMSTLPMTSSGWTAGDANETQIHLTAFYGEPFTLNCTVDKGYPLPRYEWFLENNTSEGEPSLVTLTESTSSLLVDEDFASTHGNGSLHYLCKLTNDFGSFCIHFFVTLISVPMTPTPLEATSSTHWSLQSSVNTEPVYSAVNSQNRAESTKVQVSTYSVNSNVFPSAVRDSASNAMSASTTRSQFDLISILQLLGIGVVAVLVLILIVVVVVVFRYWYFHRRFDVKPSFQEIWLPDQDFQLRRNSLYMETPGMKIGKLDKVQGLKPGTGVPLKKDGVKPRSRTRSESYVPPPTRFSPLPVMQVNPSYETISGYKCKKMDDGPEVVAPEKAKEAKDRTYDEVHIYEKL